MIPHGVCAGGREGDEHVAGLFADSAEAVRDHARTEDGFAGMEQLALAAYLEEHRSLHDVEPLILMQVEVNGRTAFEQVLVLDGEDGAAAVARGDLEEDGAEAEGVVFSEAILSGADDVDCAGGLGGLFESEGLEGCGGEQGGSGFEKRTAMHGFPPVLWG